MEGTLKANVLKWFLNFTSIGGISQFRSSDRSISKAFWRILFCVGCSLTIWNVNKVLSDYMARPVRGVLYKTIQYQ